MIRFIPEGQKKNLPIIVFAFIWLTLVCYGPALAYDSPGLSLNIYVDQGDEDLTYDLADPDDPVTFVTEEETSRLRPGGLIIDVSCDEGLGFHFARPTTFGDPMFKVGPVDYYAVDHSPSYLWESASWEISTSLLKYLPFVMGGPESWNGVETLRRAIEIRDGVVLNPKILSYQNRSPEYPHRNAEG